MNVKALLPAALATTALVATPALAHDKPEHAAKPKHAHGDQKKAEHAADKAERKARRDAKRCAPQKVAYVASGTLVSQALTKNADGSYDGTLTADVKRANHHGRSHKSTTQTYTLDDANVKFGGIPDRDANGTVDAADLRAGDRVKVMGRVTRLKKRCDTTGFTPTVTIKKVRFHEPKAA
jgi:hypothetical protein